jgi:hypothetical protein
METTHYRNSGLEKQPILFPSQFPLDIPGAMQHAYHVYSDINGKVKDSIRFKTLHLPGAEAFQAAASAPHRA